MADRTSTVRVNVVTDASGAGATLGKFGRVAGVAALGTAALGVAAAVGASKLYTFGDAADDANVSIAQGIKTMKLFGKQQEAVTKRVIDHAKQVSLATAVDINSIKATQAKLLTFRDLAETADETGGAFDRATAAAIDMAAKGFGTAETNAVQLGKALADPANGLTALKKTGALTADQIKKIGDEFQKTGDIAKAQGDILAAVEAQVGGTAEKQAGGFEKMTNALKIFGQEFAEKALPYLDRFGTFMLETGGPAIQRVATALAERLIPKLQQLGQFIRERVIPALQEFGGWIQEHVVPVVRGVLADALEGAKGLFNNVRKAIEDNGPELKDMGDKLQRLAEFILEKVVPVMSDFMETTLPALGKAIGIAIGAISNMYAMWAGLWEIITKVTAAIIAAGDEMAKLKALDGFLPNNRGAGSSASDQNNQVRLPGGGVAVTVNVPGGFIGDEVTLARAIRDALADDLRRTGGVPGVLLR